jgi:hypothetical protein
MMPARRVIPSLLAKVQPGRRHLGALVGQGIPTPCQARGCSPRGCLGLWWWERKRKAPARLGRAGVRVAGERARTCWFYKFKPMAFTAKGLLWPISS